MMKANALFGIKATSNWKGKVYNARTREVYNNISTNITAYFRAYNSLQEGIKDYFDLICNMSRYSKAKNCKTAEESIRAIGNGGYATDPNYTKLVISIIINYNLKQYDNIDLIFNTGFEINKDYVLQENLNVRKSAKVEKDNIKKYEELTQDGKKHAKYKYNGANAILLKDTIVTCKEIIKNDNDIWLKIPSGYIAAIYGGEIYVK